MKSLSLCTKLYCTKDREMSTVNAKTILDAIDVKCKFLGARVNESFGDNTPRNTYIITIKHKGVEQSFKFTDSLANTNSGKMLDGKTDKNDILESFSSDYYTNKQNYPTYQSFCEEFGYNLDSIKDRKIYRACLEESMKLARLFTPEEIEQIRQVIEGAQN